MGERITWRDRAQRHIASRSERYPGALNIEPEWTQQVIDDPDRFVVDPDTKSAIGAARIIGFSDGAGRVLVVIAEHGQAGEWLGLTAFPASGQDLAEYERRRS